MTVDSLEELSAAFEEWRSRKRYTRERMPEELVTRARRTAAADGLNRVARKIGIDRRRLSGPETSRVSSGDVVATPSYSRVKLIGSSASTHPFAELEMPSGLKVRLYSLTPETLGLLASVCSGGER